MNVKTIYEDPKHKGWEHNTAYRWELVYISETDCMRLVAMETAATLCIVYRNTCGLLS